MNRFSQLLLGFLAILMAIGAGLYGRSRYLKEVSTYPRPGTQSIHSTLYRSISRSISIKRNAPVHGIAGIFPIHF